MAKEIPLTQGHFALVDDADFHWLAQWRWAVKGPRGRCYAARTVQHEDGTSGNLQMHRLIMAPPRHLFVDHINNDPLDNRRANLRLCTLQQNAMNAPGRGAVSGFKGVFLHRRSGRYYANITVDGRSHHLGSYVDPADAARAYDAAALAHFGEFAWINFKVAA